MTALLVKRARPDLNVLLLDAAMAPIHRPCGEFLGPAGVRVLSDAGLATAVIADGARVLQGLRLYAGRSVLGADFLPGIVRPPHPHGLGVRREMLDRRLQQAAAAAGVDLRRGARVGTMVRSDGSWQVQVGGATITAALVVGADGRRSVVRRRSGLDAPCGRKRYALVCRAHGMTPPDGGWRHGEMHISPLGQVGLAPLTDGEVNLNLLLAPQTSGFLQEHPPDILMRAALRATPSLRHRSANARIGRVLATPSLPQRSVGVVANGVALVGDAAGFWDPFTGDGMSIALRSAESLARCIAGLDLRNGASERALAPYAAAWRRQLRIKRALYPGLASVLARRRLCEALIGTFGRSALLGRIMVAIEGDYLPRR